MNEIKRIASFSVNHDYIKEGVYVSRIDGDVTTYDLRTRVPNAGDYMDNITMHSVEHLFATLVRQSEIGSDVIYFGPMGCQTGFYLLVRCADNDRVLSVIIDILKMISTWDREMPGQSRVECGNYLNLDVAAARAEAARYLSHLLGRKIDFKYPEGAE